MTWVASSEEQKLLNLDHVECIYVAGTEPQEGEPELLFGVFALVSGEEVPDVLFVGTEAECQDKFNFICSKLPLLKGV